MRMQNVTATYQVQFTLNLSRKRFTIEFPLSIGKRHARYKFESPIQQLQQIFRIDDHGKKQCHLVIPYKVPPRFFKFAEGQEELSKTFSPSEKIWYENHAWLRQTDVVDGHTMTLMNAMPVMNMKNAPIIDIGMFIFTGY